ncbi:MAG: branched-chain amino acid ABC transporter permease [Rhodospirillaceae bacterium]|jgi:branched-chain amino acid transport system permease protein|nr:branched-chain amino acid ABC transporter permease [Rhodospirillaceae bacterium]MBT5563710.1 branched-chain amino acid ABC transporter permease [Rhodospirillaceae bacterium]MBT6241540.1 branched-chain amino acid ABC transporter permease [Rhodospirillaceae bacterium]MBT7137044.1 branched-chain amino acid ABC transporter permease [Rhodospirillaceae bacterium]
MSSNTKPVLLYGGILLIGIFLPLALPAFQTQISVMWMMVTFALTWDILGGRMGYNSFGNIVFFGVGMYAAASVQHELYFDIGQFEVISDQFNLQLTPDKYLFGLGLGMIIGAVICVALAWVLGSGILRLRGHYFAICTLGLGVAVGELAGTIDYIGAGSGMAAPVFPSAMGSAGLFYSYFFFILVVASFFSLKWLYSTRFGLAINAIRDDEDKAEAMGLHTTRYKTLAWCVSAFFLSFAGAGFGHLNGFIDPLDVAFPGATFGVWMVLMAILGGKGTLWGPVVGALAFHITQEFFWSTLLGWQRVALGLMIVIVVVFFPLGIMGWAREKWPERFGHTVEEES